MRCHSSLRGFTLIEMLISATLGIFIALIALAGLRSVTAARGIIDRHGEAVDELRIAAEQIRLDLNNIRPIGRTIRFEASLETTGPRIIFRTFSSNKARADQPESELYEVEYFIADADTGGKALMRRVCPMVGLTTSNTEETTEGGVLEVIAQPIEGFDASYYDSGNWTTQWSADNMRPPQLVLIHIAVGETSPKGQKKYYTRQVAVGFNQGQFTDEVTATDFDWQEAEGQWQQIETTTE